jgi:hypothetical protein
MSSSSPTSSVDIEEDEQPTVEEVTAQRKAKKEKEDKEKKKKRGKKGGGEIDAKDRPWTCLWFFVCWSILLYLWLFVFLVISFVDILGGAQVFNIETYVVIFACHVVLFAIWFCVALTRHCRMKSTSAVGIIPPKPTRTERMMPKCWMMDVHPWYPFVAVLLYLLAAGFGAVLWNGRNSRISNDQCAYVRDDNNVLFLGNLVGIGYVLVGTRVGIAAIWNKCKKWGAQRAKESGSSPTERANLT